MRLMPLHQKMLLVTKEESCSYSEQLTQNRFNHAVLIGLRNENIRNESCPISKLNSLSDEKLLENLSLDMSDDHEHSDKFNKRRTDISVIETSEKTQKPEKPENKLLTELQSLKVSHDKIKKIKAIHILNIGMFIIRLDYPNHNNNHNTLPRGCSSC